MKCLNCSNTIPDDSLFCEYCGAKTIPAEETDAESEESIFCIKCGSALPKNSSYCLFCGNRIGTYDQPVYPGAFNYDRGYNEEYIPPYTEGFEENPAMENAVKKPADILKIVTVASCIFCIAAVGVCSLFFMISRSGEEEKLKTDSRAVTVSAPADSEEMKEETVNSQDISKAEETQTENETNETNKNNEIKNDKSENKDAEIIPASDLIDMTKGELLDIIGDDYRVTYNEFFGTTGYLNGIISDTYFPNVILVPYDFKSQNEQEMSDYFENEDDDAYFSQVWVLEGGLMGNNAYVGMTYNELMTTIDSLLGVPNGVPYVNCCIDGHRACFIFDDNDKISELSEYYGSNIVSPYRTEDGNVRSLFLTFSREEESNYIPAEITADGVALRNAPYSDATILLNVNKGDTIYLQSEEIIDTKGDKWYEVSRYDFYDNNSGRTVRKIGYIHAEYVNLK